MEVDLDKTFLEYGVSFPIECRLLNQKSHYSFEKLALFVTLFWQEEDIHFQIRWFQNVTLFVGFNFYETFDALKLIGSYNFQYSLHTQMTCADVSSKVNHRGAALLKS